MRCFNFPPDGCGCCPIGYFCTCAVRTVLAHEFLLRLGLALQRDLLDFGPLILVQLLLIGRRRLLHSRELLFQFRAHRSASLCRCTLLSVP